MIKIGSIKKMWKGWRLLLFAYVDDNSPLKSQYFLTEKCVDGKSYIKIGKGGDLHLRLYVPTWSILKYVKDKSMVIFGFGKWDEEKVS